MVWNSCKAVETMVEWEKTQQKLEKENHNMDITQSFYDSLASQYDKLFLD